jgi:hypothetical protein
MATAGPDHRGVVLGPYVWKPDPQGAYDPVPTRAARTSLPTGEEVWCRHVPLGKRPLNQHRYVSSGSQPSEGSQPNYRIKCRWLGCACPRQGMGCPLTHWAGMLTPR